MSPSPYSACGPEAPSSTAKGREGSVRLLISDLSRHTFKSEVNFRVSGRRYRKDGLLGKRFDAFYINVGEREP